MSVTTSDYWAEWESRAQAIYGPVAARGALLRAMRVAEPEAWAERVRALVEAHGGNASRAAAAVGLPRSTVTKWLQDDAFAGLRRMRPGWSGKKV